MKSYDYKNLELVAHHEVAMGKLVVYALLDGVEVPIAAHKIGHFAHQLKEAAVKRVEAEQANEAAPGTATEVVPVVPHDPTAPSTNSPSSTTTTTQ